MYLFFILHKFNKFNKTDKKIKNRKCIEHDVNTEIEIAKEGLINEFKLLIITHVSGKQIDKCKNILNKIKK